MVTFGQLGLNRSSQPGCTISVQVLAEMKLVLVVEYYMVHEMIRHVIGYHHSAHH